ncbi:MAG: hypothetical protein KKI02_04585 [Planctomycetes bacterium]|nr:hypothetical protein [Planctomycetota bacterium]
MTSAPDHLTVHKDEASAASAGSAPEHPGSLRPPTDDVVPRPAEFARRERDLRRRAAVLSVLAGVVAGLIWGVVEQPRYRALTEVQVSSERGSAERIVGEHADAVMSDVVLEHWQGPPPLERWIAARAAQDLTVRLLPESGKLQLSFDSADPELAGALLPTAVKAYIAHVDALPLEHFHSPREIEWTERQAALNEELSRRQIRRQEIEARLARTPLASERSDAQVGFDEALAGFEDVVERLRGLREELAALHSQELPRGEVSAEAYQRGLAEDALYQEDLKEFASEARQYRAELAVALTLLVDPLQELRRTVQDLSATMVEQRDSRPPPNVRTLLEQCLAEVGDFERALAEFAEGWGQRRETVERLRASEQVVELVDQQNQAMGAAARLVAEARRVLHDVRTRNDSLSAEGNAGTREVVVVNVLRRSLSRVAEQVDVLAEAAGAVAPSANFRLDVHDRQLRGLRTRLRDRDERIRQVLQAEADRLARGERDEQERRLRGALSASDDERQALMDTLVTKLQRLRELDEQHQELRELGAELKAENGAITRLTDRLEQLEAERPELRRDIVTLVNSRCERTAGRHRVRNAGLAGATTFAAVGLLFLLMLAQRAQRPGTATTAADADPASPQNEQRQRPA